MNIAAALRQLDTQIKAENLEVHQYTLFQGQVGVVLLSSKELPSRPILARGIAIQNPLDEPSPKVRRFWALRRAYHAYKHRVNTEPIESDLPIAQSALRTFRGLNWAVSVYKSQYAPVIPEAGAAHRFESGIMERLNREALGSETRNG